MTLADAQAGPSWNSVFRRTVLIDLHVVMATQEVGPKPFWPSVRELVPESCELFSRVSWQCLADSDLASFFFSSPLFFGSARKTAPLLRIRLLCSVAYHSFGKNAEGIWQARLLASSCLK